MDFEAELAKFQPSLDIEQAEDAIYGNKTTDVTDLIQSILNSIELKALAEEISKQASVNCLMWLLVGKIMQIYNEKEKAEQGKI